MYQIFIDPAVSNYVFPFNEKFLYRFLYELISSSFSSNLYPRFLRFTSCQYVDALAVLSSTIFNDVSTALLCMRYISLYEFASYIYGSWNIFLKNDFVSCLSDVNFATTLLPLLPSSASSSSAATAVTYFFLCFLSCSSFYP